MPLDRRDFLAACALFTLTPRTSARALLGPADVPGSMRLLRDLAELEPLPVLDAMSPAVEGTKHRDVWALIFGENHMMPQQWDDATAIIQQAAPYCRTFHDESVTDIAPWVGSVGVYGMNVARPREMTRVAEDNHILSVLSMHYRTFHPFYLDELVRDACSGPIITYSGSVHADRLFKQYQESLEFSGARFGRPIQDLPTVQEAMDAGGLSSATLIMHDRWWLCYKALQSHIHSLFAGQEHQTPERFLQDLEIFGQLPKGCRVLGRTCVDLTTDMAIDREQLQHLIEQYHDIRADSALMANLDDYRYAWGYSSRTKPGERGLPAGPSWTGAMTFHKGERLARVEYEEGHRTRVVWRE